MLTNPKTPVADAIAAAGHALADAFDAITAMQLPDPWALVDKTGTVDVTDAIQKAITLGLTIPAGQYLVRVNVLVATRDVNAEVGAELITIPHGLDRAITLEMRGNDLSITNLRITGDRLGHYYYTMPLSTHEWCYNLYLRGDRIKAYDVVSDLATGDAVGASGAGIELHGGVYTRSRRNNLSAFNVSGFRATRTEFSYAGKMGLQPGAANGPWAGFDVEPDHGTASDIVFDACKLIGNAAVGGLIWDRAGTGVTVAGVVIKNCSIDGNANGIEAKGLGGPVDVTATGNTLSNYKGAAFKVGTGATVNIDGNIMRSTLHTSTSTKPGIVTKFDIQFPTTVVNGVTLPAGKAVVGTNIYTPPVTAA